MLFQEPKEYAFNQVAMLRVKFGKYDIGSDGFSGMGQKGGS
jgi:hypothetical protein